jgi:hypothetical protein
MGRKGGGGSEGGGGEGGWRAISGRPHLRALLGMLRVLIRRVRPLLRLPAPQPQRLVRRLREREDGRGSSVVSVGAVGAGGGVAFVGSLGGVTECGEEETSGPSVCGSGAGAAATGTLIAVCETAVNREQIHR